MFNSVFKKAVKPFDPTNFSLTHTEVDERPLRFRPLKSAIAMLSGLGIAPLAGIGASAIPLDPIDCVARETLLASSSDIGESGAQDQVSSVTEPMSARLFLAGLMGFTLLRRRRPA